MNTSRAKKKVAIVAATVTAAGGLVLAAPAAHAGSWCPGADVEVDYADGSFLCDPKHQSHRDTINSCNVLTVYAGDNWVADWSGPDMAHLQYYSMSPGTYDGYENLDPFCVSQLAINP